jgi:hypothetical protein
MDHSIVNRRNLVLGTAAAAAALAPSSYGLAAQTGPGAWQPAALGTKLTLVRMAPPAWLLAMWKEIDDKTFGAGFDCFAAEAVCNLSVADWHGREAIRANLRAFIDKGMTTNHDVVEYWDAGPFKVFHGVVTMTFDKPAIKTARPTMTHFFYMDQADPTKVAMWKGSVGPVEF